MNSAIAFLKLVRWPNLVFIAITQCLFFYFVLPFVHRTSFPFPATLSQLNFFLLVITSVCIAAGGYIINDYFDVNIDEVNKPSHLVLGKFINRRWAIAFHFTLSLIGWVLSCYIGYKIRDIYIPVFNFLSIVALWFYSTTFKKKLLIGNILISLLTAWVILVIMVAEYHTRWKVADYFSFVSRLLKLSFLYAGFAFIISLVREVIKDMEDLHGDEKYGCRTMPIVWGIPVSKVFAAVWLIVLIGAVLILQFYVLQLNWWLSAIYSVILIIIPLLWILQNLYRARYQRDYHKLSQTVKLVMLSGIISMIFFRIYL